jgi:hypothetical protein
MCEYQAGTKDKKIQGTLQRIELMTTERTIHDESTMVLDLPDATTIVAPKRAITIVTNCSAELTAPRETSSPVRIHHREGCTVQLFPDNITLTRPPFQYQGRRSKIKEDILITWQQGILRAPFDGSIVWAMVPEAFWKKLLEHFLGALPFYVMGIVIIMLTCPWICNWRFYLRRRRRGREIVYVSPDA